MDYMITFEDGSEAYLAHRGIKGMKWGVWNEETKARRNANKETKAANKMFKAEQKMLGAANRELNRPGGLSTMQLENATDKYIVKRAKLNNLHKKHGKEDDPYGIREQERQAGKYVQRRNAVGLLGGAVGTIGYNVATRNSSSAKAYSQVKHRFMRDAREQAKYGKEEVQKLLKSAENGQVMGAVFDGKGNNTYMVKPKASH